MDIEEPENFQRKSFGEIVKIQFFLRVRVVVVQSLLWELRFFFKCLELKSKLYIFLRH